ncbi:MAG: hypothetical protein CVV44_03375 [Spirochaetae bacterium HGW-Spirochaetae-1]|jgi:hypothetical protein|nr:MAG: hypothetical protein CVV44_03375 [Spirochaetae bacterium HGW-Spirochaetae-1]
MKKIVGTLFILLFQITALSAADLSWESHGIQVKSSRTVENQTILELAPGKGLPFSLRYYGDITPEMMENVLKSLASINTWTVIKPREIGMVVSNDLLDIVIQPEQFLYKKVNLLPHVPAGLLMQFDTNLKYNFRFTRNNLFVRIQGTYRTEQELCENVLEAYTDPLKYLKKRDPEFFLTKLNQFEEEITSLKNSVKDLEEENRLLKSAVATLHNTGFLGFGNKPINQKIVKRTIAVRKEKPAATAEEITDILNDEGLKTSKKEVSLVLLVYCNEFKK